MASETFTAPPSQSISKKKRSSAAVRESYQKKVSQKARPSEKALVPVPTLHEPHFAYQGKLFDNENRIADEAENRYYANQWDEFLKQNPDASEDTPVGKDYRGRTVTQSLVGDRKDYYKDIIDFDGTPRSRIKVGSNQSVGWKRESRKKKGTWNMPKYKKMREEDIDEPIYDADFEDARNSPKFRKANKDAKDLGLPKRSTPKREEPAAMRAISDRKRSVVSEINDIDKQSTKKKPSLVKSRDLVDEAFDALSDVGKTIGKAGKTVAKAGVAGIGAGFGALDQGATAFGNSTIGKNLKAQADADYKHMRSHGFRAAESIKGTANTGKKAGMTAGSLITPKGHRNVRSKESGTGNIGSEESLEIHGISCRYVKGSHGKVEKHWFYHERQVDFKDVEKVLTAEQIRKLRASADDVFKGHIKIGSLSGSSNNGVPTVGNRGDNGLVNNTKKAYGLVTQKRIGASHDTDYGYEPAYGNNQTIAGVANKTAGVVTTKTRTGGITTMKTHSDVVVSTIGGIGTSKKIATPEGLFSKKDGGIQAETKEASPSKINKRKSGGIRAKTRPATPSRLLGKTGNSEKTVTGGLATRQNRENGTTKTQRGIVSQSKPMTLGSIDTPKRNAGGTSA